VPRDRVNGTYGEVSTCTDWGRLDLTPGVWTIEVEGTERGTGPFSFGLLTVPADQTYQVSIGDTISGHLDSPGARALYYFSGTPGQLVNLDTSGGCGANRQIEYRITTPDDLESGGGYLTTCLSFDGIKLPAGGRYVVEVRALDDTGAFTLKLTAA
jgi:hypothetical protein